MLYFHAQWLTAPHIGSYLSLRAANWFWELVLYENEICVECLCDAQDDQLHFVSNENRNIVFGFGDGSRGVGDLKDRILLRRCDDFAGSSGSQLWPRSHSNQSKLRFIFFKTRTRPGRINMDHGERSQWDNRLLFNTCRAAFIHRSNCCGGAGQIMAPKDLKRSSQLCF